MSDGVPDPELTVLNLMKELEGLTDPIKFGTLLGFPEHEMEIIRRDNNHDTNGQKYTLYRKISRNCRSKGINWDKIADSLDELGDGDLALEIRRKFCKTITSRNKQHGSQSVKAITPPLMRPPRDGASPRTAFISKDILTVGTSSFPKSPRDGASLKTESSKSHTELLDETDSAHTSHQSAAPDPTQTTRSAGIVNFRRDMNCSELCEYLKYEEIPENVIEYFRNMDGDTFIKLHFDQNALKKEIGCELTHEILNKLSNMLKKIQGENSITSLAPRVLMFHNKENKLGEGGFGIVYKGEYHGQLCAIKYLRSSVEFEGGVFIPGSEKSRSREQFDRECQFIQSCDHPNIVKHFDTIVLPLPSGRNQVFLVLELMDTNLTHCLEGNTQFECKKKIQVCHNIASGLVYIHNKDIVHRDLCSENILLRRHPLVAKISDFGISRIIDEKTSKTPTRIPNRTGYLPSEVRDTPPSRYGSSVDIFSFGAIATQLVNDVSFIEAPAERNIFVDRIEDNDPLKPIIMQCLNADKTKRPCASDLEKDLGKLLREH